MITFAADSFRTHPGDVRTGNSPEGCDILAMSLPERCEITGRLGKLLPFRDRDSIDFGVHPYPERLGKLRQRVGEGQVDE